MSPWIQLRGVEKSYRVGGGQVWVLRRIDLSIEPGEFVTIMGPSGAGKTTLLHILGLLDNEWTGEFQFGDQAVHELKLKERNELRKRRVGLVFQAYHLLDDLTVAENLDVPLSYLGIPRSERQSRVADMLDRFQIVGKKDLFPNQLSGGQQQLVGIARALIIDPEVLLADEPTGNLHSEQGREIMEIFADLNRKGRTIVQVTHSAENAGFGNRIVRLRDGWLQGEEKVEQAPAGVA